MAHRNSITIEVGGRFYNVAGTSTKAAQRREVQTSRGFATESSAVASAKRRSKREIPPGSRGR